MHLLRRSVRLIVSFTSIRIIFLLKVISRLVKVKSILMLLKCLPTPRKLLISLKPSMSSLCKFLLKFVKSTVIMLLLLRRPLAVKSLSSPTRRSVLMLLFVNRALCSILPLKNCFVVVRRIVRNLLKVLSPQLMEVTKMKRKHIGRKHSERLFTSTALKIKPQNIQPMPMRGGIRA